MAKRSRMFSVPSVPAVLAVLLALLIPFAASAETAPAVVADDLLGTWQVADYDGATITFEADGTMVMSLGGQSQTARWLVEDGAFYLGTMTCVVDGDTMTLSLIDIADQSITFARVDGTAGQLTGTWQMENSGVIQQMIFTDDGTVRSIASSGKVVYSDETTTWIFRDGILYNGVDCVYDATSMIIGLNGSTLSLTR